MNGRIEMKQLIDWIDERFGQPENWKVKNILIHLIHCNSCHRAILFQSIKDLTITLETSTLKFIFPANHILFGCEKFNVSK